ncbi:MAG: hypothetical protein WCP97_09180 [bacterium]
MENSSYLKCPECNTTNRIPNDRIVKDAKCGKCKAALIEKGKTQHYLFAHRLLRNLFAEDPDKFALRLLDENHELLRKIWNLVGNVNGYSHTQPVFKITCIKENPFIIIITLPEPENMTEAYFIALLLPNTTSNTSDSSNVALPRYLTLERTAEKNGCSTGCLCEWSGINYTDHVNYGLAEPTHDDFIKLLSMHTTREASLIWASNQLQLIKKYFESRDSCK